VTTTFPWLTALRDRGMGTPLGFAVTAER